MTFPVASSMISHAQVNRAEDVISKRSIDEVSSYSKKRSADSQAKRQKTSVVASKQFNFIYDQYTEARGEPKMLEITCRKCNAWVMDYQKDGPGKLLRCYLDRIYHPKALRKATFTQNEAKSAPPLKCLKCETILGNPFIYKRRFPKPETRPAYIIVPYRDIHTEKYLPSIIFKEREPK